MRALLLLIINDEYRAPCWKYLNTNELTNANIALKKINNNFISEKIYDRELLCILDVDYVTTDLKVNFGQLTNRNAFMDCLEW